MGIAKILHRNHPVEEVSDVLECPRSLLKEFKTDVFNGMLAKLPSSKEMAEVGARGEFAEFDWYLPSLSLSRDGSVKKFTLTLVEEPEDLRRNFVIQQYDFAIRGDSVFLPSLNDVLSGENDVGVDYEKRRWGDPVKCKNEAFDFKPYVDSLMKKLQSPDVKVQLLENKVEKLQERLNNLERKKKFTLGF